METNSTTFISTIPINLRPLFEQTNWERWKIPKDIFKTMIIYLSESKCGYCECYLVFGQQFCFECLSKKEKKYLQKYKIKREEQQRKQIRLLQLNKIITGDFKKNIETHDGPINKEIARLKNILKDKESALSEAKSCYEKFKDSYRLLMSERKFKEIDRFLKNISPSQVEYYETLISNLELEIASLNLSIKEAEDRLFGPYGDKCSFHGHYDKYCGPNNCKSKNESYYKNYIKTLEFEIEMIRLQLNERDQSIDMIRKLSHLNKNYIDAYTYATIHGITWDKFSFAQEDLFKKVEEHKKANT